MKPQTPADCLDLIRLSIDAAMAAGHRVAAVEATGVYRSQVSGMWRARAGAVLSPLGAVLIADTDRPPPSDNDLVAAMLALRAPAAFVRGIVDGTIGREDKAAVASEQGRRYMEGAIVGAMLRGHIEEAPARTLFAEALREEGEHDTIPDPDAGREWAAQGGGQ